MSIQEPTPPLPPPLHWQSEARAFIDRGRELYAETAQSALTVNLKLVIRGLTSITLVFQLVFSSRVGFHFFEASSWNGGS